MRKTRNTGFGLVEILIALSLGLVIVLGVSQLFTTGSSTMSSLEETGRRIENSVFAGEMVASDLRLVGYWGEAATPIAVGEPLLSPGEMVESLGAFTVVPSNMPPHACLGTAEGDFYTTALSGAEEKAYIELVYGMSYPLLTGNGGVLSSELDKCNAGTTPAVGSEFIAIRRASSCALSDAGCEAAADGMFYMQHQACDALNTAGDIRLSDTQADFDFETVACSGVAAPIYKYISRVYYVDTDDYLVRLDMTYDSGAVTYSARRLVPGVELMRFQWGIDTNGDGVADRIERTPADPADWADADWGNIVSATIWMLVRSQSEVTQQSGNRNTSFVIAGETFTPTNANFARVVQSRTVDIVNVSGRRR